jgi:hypothetical protein
MQPAPQRDASPEQYKMGFSLQTGFSQLPYFLDDAEPAESVPVTNSLTFEQMASERLALIPQRQVDWLEFQKYAEAWKQSRPRATSSAMLLAADENYFRIINMSKRAIPCLLKQLQLELAAGSPDHWFIALWIVTDLTNPVPPESRGKLKEMAKAWIEWGKQQGFVDDGDVGGGLSRSG